jgi:hypothetical protein
MSGVLYKLHGRGRNGAQCFDVHCLPAEMHRNHGARATRNGRGKLRRPEEAILTYIRKDHSGS